MTRQFAAITDIGQSEVARPTSRSTMQLTVDAALEAMRDAGLTSRDIDGVACWPGDNDNGSPFTPVGPLALKSVLEIETNRYGGGYEAPGPLAAVINAAIAV